MNPISGRRQQRGTHNTINHLRCRVPIRLALGLKHHSGTPIPMMSNRTPHIKVEKSRKGGKAQLKMGRQHSEAA